MIDKDYQNAVFRRIGLEHSAMRDNTDVNWIMTLLALFNGVLLGGAAFYIFQSSADKKEFMRECEADHKHYECVVLWRGDIGSSRMVGGVTGAAAGIAAHAAGRGR